MIKYYTRACNFYYGKTSKEKVIKRLALPLHGNSLISFDKIEIISRKNIRTVDLKDIKKLQPFLRKKILIDIKQISKKKYFRNLNLNNSPLLMGILNLTPDSFSDGGKFLRKNLGYRHAKKLVKDGCSIIDIGGESTRPGSKEISPKNEWKRIYITLSKLKNLRNIISLDTRNSLVMKLGIKKNVKLINDVSGLNHDPETINLLKKTRIPFIVHHMQGKPMTMQINPKYKNVLLDIYDFFENKIKYIRAKGIVHNNIILDPGIGFGKKLKHNITLLRNISIFHSLGFPVMLGTSRKRFIKDLSGINDSEERLGGTISSSLFAMMHGVQILRVHDVNEVMQSIKVFNTLKL